jgi:carnitine 3-dehydrogenase
MNNQAAILGGGVIGGGWAARFLLMGWNVTVYDPDPDAERKISEVLENANRSMPALSEVALPQQGKLTFSNTIKGAVASAAWIQESVPERLDLKQQVFTDVQAACPINAVIASSTSGFKPSQLQEGALRPSQIIVAHPFNPVYLLPLVELVGPNETIGMAQNILQHLGMFPLHVRKEIDAHIADRLLEAVWREALWLIKDGIATTQEIDDAIRYGFGLRWAQMGLFETYRVAGGEAGMAHFIKQFGPALKWPWTKLMDVPELTADLIQDISDQSDAQSGEYSIRELERRRDDNLVGILRALKVRNWGAGAILNAQDARLKPPLQNDISQPLKTISRTVPIDWTDYNGHMNESRYGQVFSDAADQVMEIIGANNDYVTNGLSYFTVDIHIRFLKEAHAGDQIAVRSRVLEGQGKKLRLFHEMKSRDGQIMSTGEQLLIHVDLKTRRSCDPVAGVAAKLAEITAAHAKLPSPDNAGEN